MKKIYTTAMGKKIDLQGIAAVNEETIAVGNMKVNARGDQLGPGGVVQRSRNAAIADHYHVPAGAVPKESREEKIQRQRMSGAGLTKKTATAKSTEGKSMSSENKETPENEDQNSSVTESESTEVQTNEESPQRRLRGSLAGSLAGETTVTQEKMVDPRKPKGPSRI